MTGRKQRLNDMAVKAKLEFKLQDMWIGAYWAKHPDYKKIWHGTLRVKYDVWICIIPTIPIHLQIGTEQKSGDCY
jgi:hypothetical protein